MVSNGLDFKCRPRLRITIGWTESIIHLQIETFIQDKTKQKNIKKKKRKKERDEGLLSEEDSKAHWCHTTEIMPMMIELCKGNITVQTVQFK